MADERISLSDMIAQLSNELAAAKEEGKDKEKEPGYDPRIAPCHRERPFRPPSHLLCKLSIGPWILFTSR